MLTIYVSNVDNILFDERGYPETNRMPDDIVRDFWVWYDPDEDRKICVFTPTLINFIGEMIEQGHLEPHKFQIITNKGVHFYNSLGVMDNEWPHGIFNY